jgi:putative pyruvate formate lyase activating enzyme
MELEITSCGLCPRECGADRTKERGRCGGGGLPRLARAALHRWEEPCLSGSDPARGSGAVFFSGCPLGCCFCQNYTISEGNFGREVTVRRLARIFLELQEAGAWNLNLVSATQYLPWVVRALDLVKGRLSIPVVWNSGGYEKVETLRVLEGYVDIWLPDLKFHDPALGDACAGAPDYFHRACAAIEEMYRQAGPLEWGEGGMLRRGLMVRHLVLPGFRKDSEKLLRWLAEAIPPQSFLLSLMSQYTPYRPAPVKSLNRRVATFEYNWVRDLAQELGFQGYGQERTSAKEEYTPPFDLAGVEGKELEE